MKVGILIHPNCSIWSASAAMEILKRANRVWKYINGNTEKLKFFDVRYVTSSKSTFNNLFNLNDQTETIFNNVVFDLIIIPALKTEDDQILTNPFDVLDQKLSESHDSINWIKKQYFKQTKLVSFCSGMLLLAEAGLLSKREVTTHWSLKHYINKKFPEISMDLSKSFIEYEDIIIGGSSISNIPLIIGIIEKYMDKITATAISKIFFTHNPEYCISLNTININDIPHTDQKIQEVQSYIKQNLYKIITIDEIADYIKLNKRTLSRRFKNATGDTPINYINKLKVERAKYLIAFEKKSFDEISFSLGYQDTSSFRKIFIKQAGVNPKVYKSRF